ncbi:hypothetical protein C8J57DRAFT_1274876 [Mycena rebaudengoi]|nr:hypothetical protein C8J57DRAFT_1274876 [Mycena rebaudengoi]
MSFTFTNYDIQNSNVVPYTSSPSETVGFRVVTERSRMDSPKRTTLYRGNFSLADSSEKAEGELGLKVIGRIAWKEKTLEVNGVSKPFKEEVGKADTEFVATYTALKLKMGGKYELPSLNFHTPGLSEDEMAGLIFALLFSDIELPAKQKPLTFKAAAGQAAVNVAATVAGNIAGNAIGNCCTVQ